jgi:hypothetical protein
MSKVSNIWKPKPEEEDYAAGRKFLSLMFSDKDAIRLVGLLRRARVNHWEAKDVLRASQCTLLEKDSEKVAADLKKIDKGKKLSPVLLIRGDARMGIPLIIADGHHRVCASWYWDESAPIACCIASVPK